jgi:hypothetical protein
MTPNDKDAASHDLAAAQKKDLEERPRCPIPKALRHLRVFAGLPVPATVLWVDDKPDFRQMDPKKCSELVDKKLCGICGQPMGDRCYWIGGKRCYENHMFIDLPMHRVCAEESMKLCPFLNGNRTEYRGHLPTSSVLDASKRPDVMLLMEGKTKNIELVSIDGNTLLFAGKYLYKVKTF